MCPGTDWVTVFVSPFPVADWNVKQELCICGNNTVSTKLTLQGMEHKEQTTWERDTVSLTSVCGSHGSHLQHKHTEHDLH